ncbi:MAG: hypothetical protein NTY19_21705 [Planctomycetota bacterium]|nr:hypothetical protein [Planctomycetota bacterium]
MVGKWIVGVAVLGVTCYAARATAVPNSPDDRTGKAPGLVAQIKVLPDQAPDCSSLRSIVATITRDCQTNDEKAIAIYNFMQLSHYHRAYPGEPGGLPVLKEINCYGWSLCGGLHSEQSALWRELGWGWRFVGWDGHTTVEAQYDGQWHYLDAFLKFYAWMPNPHTPGGRTIAGEEALKNNPSDLIQNAFVLDPARQCVYARDNQFARYGDRLHWQAPSFLSCGDELDGVIRGLKTQHRAGADEGWAGIVHASGSYSADVNLRPGGGLTNTWDPLPDAWYWGGNNVAPAHTCGGHKDTRNDPGIGLVLEPYVTSKPARSYANGRLTCHLDFSSDALLQSLAASENVTYADRSLRPARSGQPGIAIIELASPYVMTKASGEAAGADTVEVSTDGGTTYRPVVLQDFSTAVQGQVAVLVKVTFREALKALRLEAIVQNNPGSLPYLSPGKNTVTVSLADPQTLGSNRLVVTYAYRLGSRKKSFEQLYDEDKELAKAHDAEWDDTVTCVQTTFTAQELPGKFDLDCPTPKGRYPVYPRMLFVRREVLAPGQQPAPLPAPPCRPTVGADQELASLPSPWSSGTQTPPPVPTRPTQRSLLPATRITHISKQGEVFQHNYVKWLKDNSDAWIMLVDFEAARLPTAKDLASARLVLYVEEAHEKAPMQVAAVMLAAAFESGRPYDFAQLGQHVGSVVVSQGNGAPFAPPRRYEIDVTKAVRAWAGGVKPAGLAVRIVPNRSVDDGWTVRFTPARDKSPELELVTYTDNK